MNDSPDTPKSSSSDAQHASSSDTRRPASNDASESVSSSVPEDDCLAVWCAGEDWCAVTCTMDVIGNKWHPVIVQRLLADGPLRFNDLSEAVGAITNKVLSNSLKDLQENGLVERTVVNDQPVEVEYALTDRGRSLEPVIDALQDWGETHLRPADDPDASAC